MDFEVELGATAPAAAETSISSESTNLQVDHNIEIDGTAASPKPEAISIAKSPASKKYDVLLALSEPWLLIQVPNHVQRTYMLAWCSLICGIGGVCVIGVFPNRIGLVLAPFPLGLVAILGVMAEKELHGNPGMHGACQANWEEWISFSAWSWLFGAVHKAGAMVVQVCVDSSLL